MSLVGLFKTWASIQPCFLNWSDTLILYWISRIADSESHDSFCKAWLKEKVKMEQTLPPSQVERVILLAASKLYSPFFAPIDNRAL